MKLVVNRCFGGFGLSQKAVELYFQLKGWKLISVPHGSLYTDYYNEKEDDKTYWYAGDLERNDPTLLQVVATLGEEANGRFADLEIIDIPDDINWEITDYDGMESVEEIHRRW